MRKRHFYICVLLEQNTCFMSFGDIIKDIQKMACSLQRVAFYHVRKDRNQTAHVLARMTLVCKWNFLVRLEYIQVFLESVIHSEFAKINISTIHLSQKRMNVC